MLVTLPFQAPGLSSPKANFKEPKYNPGADPSRMLTKEDLIYGYDTQPANEEADEEQSEAKDLSDGVNKDKVVTE